MVYLVFFFFLNHGFWLFFLKPWFLPTLDFDLSIIDIFISMCFLLMLCFLLMMSQFFLMMSQFFLINNGYYHCILLYNLFKVYFWRYFYFFYFYNEFNFCVQFPCFQCHELFMVMKDPRIFFISLHPFYLNLNTCWRDSGNIATNLCQRGSENLRSDLQISKNLIFQIFCYQFQQC